MNESDAERTAPKTGRDKWIKAAFVVAAILAVTFVWMVQRRTPGLGWSEDLEGALRQGQTLNRRVLVFFGDTGEISRRMVATTLARPENKQAIESGKFICVQANTSLTTPLASRYKLKLLPTMLIVSPAGRELNRREGFIGEVLFRRGFLDLKQVVKAGG